MEKTGYFWATGSCSHKEKTRRKTRTLCKHIQLWWAARRVPLTYSGGLQAEKSPWWSHQRRDSFPNAQLLLLSGRQTVLTEAQSQPPQPSSRSHCRPRESHYCSLQFPLFSWASSENKWGPTGLEKEGNVRDPCCTLFTFSKWVQTPSMESFAWQGR